MTIPSDTVANTSLFPPLKTATYTVVVNLFPGLFTQAAMRYLPLFWPLAPYFGSACRNGLLAYRAGHAGCQVSLFGVRRNMRRTTAGRFIA